MLKKVLTSFTKWNNITTSFTDGKNGGEKLMTLMEQKRLEKKYTQQFMADSIEVSVGCYNMYENNQRKIPKDKAEKISTILGCKIEDIFTPSNLTVCKTNAKND